MSERESGAITVGRRARRRWAVTTPTTISSARTSARSSTRRTAVTPMPTRAIRATFGCGTRNTGGVSTPRRRPGRVSRPTAGRLSGASRAAGVPPGRGAWRPVRRSRCACRPSRISTIPPRHRSITSACGPNGPSPSASGRGIPGAAGALRPMPTTGPAATSSTGCGTTMCPKIPRHGAASGIRSRRAV